jgi:hypothetical protein
MKNISSGFETALRYFAPWIWLSVADFDSVEIPVKRYDDTESLPFVTLPVHITDPLGLEIAVAVKEFTSKAVAHQCLDRQALRRRIGG